MNSVQRRRFQKREKTQIRKQNREIVENPQVVLNNNDIPQDTIYEILTRLPVKSILRFKAVSKLWHSTISNPTFRMRCPPTSVFAISRSNTKDFYLMDEEGGSEKFQVPAWSRLEYKDSFPAISNSCNGMLLLRQGTAIFLFNPSTRNIDKVLTLDKCYDNKYTSKMGFCYDETISDYKALIIFIRADIEKYCVIVSSLKQKNWTTVRIPDNFCHMSRGHLVNDRLHFAIRGSDVRGGYDAHNSIVYFNPIKDVIEKVACPQPKSGDEDAILGLGVLEGYLCMARRIGENVEVLKMKEYGVAESWTSIFFLIKYSDQVTRYNFLELLLMTKNGEILIKTGCKMWSCNLVKKSFTEFVPNGDIRIKAAVTFEESLFSRERSVMHKYRKDDHRRHGGVGHIGRKCSIARRSAVGFFNSGKIGHFAKHCPQGVVCHNCGTPGHFAKDCIF